MFLIETFGCLGCRLYCQCHLVHHGVLFMEAVCLCLLELICNHAAQKCVERKEKNGKLPVKNLSEASS